MNYILYVVAFIWFVQGAAFGIKVEDGSIKSSILSECIKFVLIIIATILIFSMFHKDK